MFSCQRIFSFSLFWRPLSQLSSSSDSGLSLMTLVTVFGKTRKPQAPSPKHHTPCSIGEFEKPTVLKIEQKQAHIRQGERGELQKSQVATSGSPCPVGTFAGILVEGPWVNFHGPSRLLVWERDSSASLAVCITGSLQLRWELLLCASCTLLS